MVLTCMPPARGMLSSCARENPEVETREFKSRASLIERDVRGEGAGAGCNLWSGREPELARADFAHRFLQPMDNLFKRDNTQQCIDTIEGLGRPTLENLCAFIARQVQVSGLPLSAVAVWRHGIGDRCTLRVD